MTAVYWPEKLRDVIRRAGITQVGYVPDAGHSYLIEQCRTDPNIADVSLTSEEEGIALAAGAWLGGARCALLMQSSGVGNCVNMLSLIKTCRFPLLMFVTMRGESEEFNPWQVPMGSIVEPTLNLCGVETMRATKPDDVEPIATSAVQRVFGEEAAVAVILSQQLIGKKVWTK